jgi:hypothetical protein
VNDRRARHHFRPILHLHHFADHAGLTFLYDKRGEQRTGQYHVKVLGAERYLYAPGEGGYDPRDDRIERWLADMIDGPAAEPLERTRRNLRLDNARRSRLAAYIAAQDMRTPAARDTLVPIFQRELNAWYAGLARDLPRLRKSILDATGVDYSESELGDAHRSYSVEVTKGVWLDFIRDNLNRAAARLHDSVWHVVRAPANYEFLTNDIGIVKFSASFKRPVNYVLGFFAARDRWLVPLDPKAALAIGPGGDVTRIRAEPSWMDATNTQVVADAARFVYSKTCDLRVTRLIGESAA